MRILVVVLAVSTLAFAASTVHLWRELDRRSRGAARRCAARRAGKGQPGSLVQLAATRRHVSERHARDRAEFRIRRIAAITDPGLLSEAARSRRGHADAGAAWHAL